MELMKKDKRTEEDFSETLALVFKYKAVETSLKKAEYFVNVSDDALAVFRDREDKRILQNLTVFSFKHPLNAETPIFVTFGGIVISAIPMHPLKAELPIEFKVSGRIKDVIPTLP